MAEFQKIVTGFVTVIDDISKQVEQEKIKAIGSRNRLKSVAKERDTEQQQLQALIREKSSQLERLKIQHRALLKEEQEQTDFIAQLSLQK